MNNHQNPFRDMMMPESWYVKLDPGIRFPILVLHASGIATCQSCEGGTGHAYTEPTIDLESSGSDALGFAALAALTSYAIDVGTVGIVWSVVKGLPYERLWRITLRRTYEDRVNDRPIFTHGYIATPDDSIPAFDP